MIEYFLVTKVKLDASAVCVRADTPELGSVAPLLSMTKGPATLEIQAVKDGDIVRVFPILPNVEVSRDHGDVAPQPFNP